MISGETYLNTGQSLFAAAVGVGTRNAKDEWLEVYFPVPLYRPSAGGVARLAAIVGYKGGNVSVSLTGNQRYEMGRLGEPYTTLSASAKPIVAVLLAEDLAPGSVPETYLKLHLLSHRLVKPRELNLEGLFKILANVAWTSRGPVDLAELPALQHACRARGAPLTVHMVDKFPQLVDYVVLPDVSIADAARVRLGAFLGCGTTVTAQGVINFNAGTEGPNLVEGRINPGVWVGRGSHLGGDSSTMGVLSGGNTVAVSVGRDCQIGARAGVGIPLGDFCTIEAGLYVTAGSKVSVLGARGEALRTVKARELAGEASLHFRRNSLAGNIECLPAAQTSKNQSLPIG